MDMTEDLLSREGLSFDRLRNFCRIAEAGGIAKAAGGNPGKQSLYSRQIKELEAFFGVPLKTRRGKSMVLTEAGQQLARLTRAQLLELVNFQQTARNIPQRISIGSGNSVIEWLLVPRMEALSQALPEAQFEYKADRTRTIVTQLVDLTLDVGIIREDAVQRPLKSTPLTSVGYSLFVPKRLSPGLTTATLRQRLVHLPLATSVGGQFRTTLEARGGKLGWSLNIAISCSSFTQAARLVFSGNYGGVLPGIARVEFDPARVAEFPLPFLKDYSRKLCVAWNPRLLEVRPFIRHAVESLVK